MSAGFRSVLKRSIPSTALDTLRRARRWRQNLLLGHLRTRYVNPDYPTWHGPVVFLIGAARSGTTLLSEILAAGSRIDNFGEPPETFRAVLGLSIFDRRFMGLTSIDAIREELYTSRRPLLREDRTYVEKWPGNALLVRELSEVFPHARFVHIIRDGRAVADSAYRRYGGEWLTGTLNSFTNFAMNQEGYDSTLPLMARGGLRWRIQVEAAMEGLSRLSAERSHTLRYEDLMADPEKAVEEVFRFLELPYRRLLVPTVNRSDRQAWTEWTASDRLAFKQVAGELLTRLGYARDEDW